MRIILSASNTASLDRLCTGNGDVGSACRLRDALAFAIKQSLVSCDSSSIAQTHAQHLIASLASTHASEPQGRGIRLVPCSTPTRYSGRVLATTDRRHNRNFYLGRNSRGKSTRVTYILVGHKNIHAA